MEETTAIMNDNDQRFSNVSFMWCYANLYEPQSERHYHCRSTPQIRLLYNNSIVQSVQTRFARLKTDKVSHDLSFIYILDWITVLLYAMYTREATARETNF